MMQRQAAPDEVTFYGLVRRLVGEVFGFDAYLSRCHISPHIQFRRIDCDGGINTLCPDNVTLTADIVVLIARVRLLFALTGYVPIPNDSTRVGEWIDGLENCLRAAGISEKEACFILNQYFSSPPEDKPLRSLALEDSLRDSEHKTIGSIV